MAHKTPPLAQAGCRRRTGGSKAPCSPLVRVFFVRFERQVASEPFPLFPLASQRPLPKKKIQQLASEKKKRKTLGRDLQKEKEELSRNLFVSVPAR